MRQITYSPDRPPKLPPDARIIRQSVDARHGKIRLQLTLDDAPAPAPRPFAPQTLRGEPVVIVGTGPAGLFAALELLEHGIRPILLERGEGVHERKRTLATLQRTGTLDPDSNYCYGEGGAGTFSDGKLYTRSKKRGDNQRLLELLVDHGAPREILWQAHPHIGSDALPAIITRIRQSIEQAGGTFCFRSTVNSLLKDSHGRVTGVATLEGQSYPARAVIFATGHSARDGYDLLEANGAILQPKGFAMGVRIEHPQALITRIQYHNYPHPERLPVAEYRLVTNVSGVGVYSFCMCPGGMIVPAQTSPGECVVNGMSPARRNTPYANAGTVVSIPAERFQTAREALAYQQNLERLAFREAGCSRQAPAQRLSDFVAGKASGSLPKSSFIPGLVASELHRWLPAEIGEPLRAGVRSFGAVMKGYLTEEAVAVGVESRTSSPVRVCRDAKSLEAVNLPGLYPCGEGAGYAGGIVSSGIDGQRCAQAIAAGGC